MSLLDKDTENEKAWQQTIAELADFGVGIYGKIVDIEKGKSQPPIPQSAPAPEVKIVQVPGQAPTIEQNVPANMVLLGIALVVVLLILRS